MLEEPPLIVNMIDGLAIIAKETNNFHTGFEEAQEID